MRYHHNFRLIPKFIYGLLCVVSQYQELKAGRGRALDDQLYRVPNVHYNCQPTATSMLSATSRKPTLGGVSFYETRPTPTQSPTNAMPPSASPSTGHMDALSPPSAGDMRRGSRKSVKFETSPVDRRKIIANAAT
ncbi:unnamed protein product [Callosobruchus maculatus]|uniref:Uncharacterized protein n=1 Tax=Callosobruchus maculatus TaxID=64391 RepID=A0A653C4R7_CALMS|nr:unnamed protein product [Callosobruchus maculatus]